MSRSKFPAWTIAMVLFVAICGIASADWPQFLGPQRDGIAHDVKALPTSLAEENVKQIWKVDLGSGFGAPVIFGDSVFVLDREGNDRDILRRIDVQTGKEKWRFTYPAPGKVDYNGSRQSPSVDGKMVYAIGPFGHINAVRMEDGTAVWSGHIIKDWDGAFPNWGVAQSPLLMGDNIIIAPWGKKAAVVALEKATGKVVWTSPNPDGIVMDYQSPMPMKLGERQTIVACGTKGYAIGVDAATGERLWTYKGYECRHHIPSPTVLEGGRVLLTGGYSAGSAMIKVEQKDGAYAVTELWKNSNVASKIPQPLVHNGHIYSNSSDNNGGLRCVTEAGEIKWDSKKKGRTFDMGNLIMVDDLIFIVDGKGGKLHMVKVNPNEYEELGRISPLSGKEVWAPLAYSDGKLVLRDQKKMVCLQFKRQGD